MSRAAQGMAFAISAGILLTTLNAIMREVTSEIDVYQAQMLRYFFGLVVMFPSVFRDGIAAYRPHGMWGQAWRGVVHTAGLTLWFTALPHLALADVTALGFTTPIFIMIGAVVFLGEKPDWRRWTAAAIGFLGVMVVVAPGFSGSGGIYNFVMLASSPLFAASFLITKALTKRDSPQVIVFWQALTVTLFTIPFAIPGWSWPSPWIWLLLLGCGLLGSAGHFFLTRAFALADISASQPLRFLDLIWAASWGFLLFHEVPSTTTLMGAAVIFVATTWIARSEARNAKLKGKHTA
jgi:drug/metabolite transporter (DMT)-like permease